MESVKREFMIPRGDRNWETKVGMRRKLMKVTYFLLINNPRLPFRAAKTHRSKDRNRDSQPALSQLHILSLAILD